MAHFHDLPTSTSSRPPPTPILYNADWFWGLQNSTESFRDPGSLYLQFDPPLGSWSSLHSVGRCGKRTQIMYERFPQVPPGLCSYHVCSDYIGQDAVIRPHLIAGRLENIGQLHTSTAICTGRMRDRAISPISGLDYRIDGDAIHWYRRYRGGWDFRGGRAV